MSCDYLKSVPIRRLPHPIDENPIWSILTTTVSNIFAVALSLPFLLAFLLLLPACLSIRWLLLFIYCNRYGSNGSGPESVRGNDSRWLGTEWRSSVIHAVLVFEAKEGVNVDHFRRLLLERVIPLYPRLTQRLISLPILTGVGNCWLTDSKFSINEHVFSGPVFLTNEKDLQEYVSKLVEDGLPENKPPWQLQVFQSFGLSRDTVAILRVHQSVADGTALMRLLCHSLADSQVIEIPEKPRYGSLAFCLNIFRACIIGPLTLILWIFLSGEDCNILTHRSKWTGSVTVSWSASITLPKVVRIKQVTRSTVNCVLLSALAGALRRMLQGCGVQQPPDMKVVVPMDLRDQTSTTHVRTSLGNKTSSLIMSLPVAIEGCIPRLWATRKTLGSLRTSSDPVILYVATSALMSVGSASFARDLVNFLTDKASLQFSSLPGPTSEIFLEGQTLKGIYPILPAQANLGISITSITYADQVFVSVMAERALGPAAELILEYLKDQIEILWKLLLNRRVPGEQKSPTQLMKTTIPEPPFNDEKSSKLNLVQKENETKDNDKEGKICSLKAEFSELVDEIKRRESINEANNLDDNHKSQGALSCSTFKSQMVDLPKYLRQEFCFSDFLSCRETDGMNKSTTKKTKHNVSNVQNSDFKALAKIIQEKYDSNGETAKSLNKGNNENCIISILKDNVCCDCPKQISQISKDERVKNDSSSVKIQNPCLSSNNHEIDVICEKPKHTASMSKNSDGSLHRFDFNSIHKQSILTLGEKPTLDLDCKRVNRTNTLENPCIGLGDQTNLGAIGPKHTNCDLNNKKLVGETDFKEKAEFQQFNSQFENKAQENFVGSFEADVSGGVLI